MSKKGRKINWNDLSIHIFLLAAGIIITMPILIALFTSFKTSGDVFTYPPRLFPRQWTIENYIIAWNSSPFGRFLVNSVIQTSIIVICQVTFSILAAYVFAFMEFPGKKILFALILASLMVPFQLTFIPNFILISNWNLANTYAGLTLPFLASVFGIFLLRQFFLSIPHELKDSATIDGAGHFRFLWQIVVPLSKGAISAFGIFSFLSAWNQYLWPLIVTDDANMRTIQAGIRYFMANEDQLSQWGAVMAGTVIVMIPTLLLFLIAQRQLVKGIALSGLKG